MYRLSIARARNSVELFFVYTKLIFVTYVVTNIQDTYNIADIVKFSNSVTGDEPTLKHEGLFIITLFSTKSLFLL